MPGAIPSQALSHPCDPVGPVCTETRSDAPVVSRRSVQVSHPALCYWLILGRALSRSQRSFGGSLETFPEKSRSPHFAPTYDVRGLKRRSVQHEPPFLVTLFAWLPGSYCRRMLKMLKTPPANCGQELVFVVFLVVEGTMV